MGKKKIGILLIASMIVTGLPWAQVSYAAENGDIIVETFETVPVDEPVTEVEENNHEGIVNETYETTPVSETEAVSNEETTRPSGVVSMTLKTTAVEETPEDTDTDRENHETKQEGTETVEVTGKSSLPDPSELGMYAEDVVNMIMPVISDETYNFVMDTDNLLSRFSDNKDDYEKASLYFNNTSGVKRHTNTSDAALAKNKSSVPVLMYVTLQVENYYGWDLNYTDMDSVEADEGRNISFALIPVSGNRIEDSEGEEDTSSDEQSNKEYTLLTDKKISIDETGKAEMVLYLPGTSDNFDIIEGMYMAKDDALWSSLGFAVTGTCNTKADWKDVDDKSAEGENIGIHISYRMDTLTEEQKAWIEEGNSPDPESGVILFGLSE